jgi:hypothetical protein
MHKGTLTGMAYTADTLPLRQHKGVHDAVPEAGGADSPVRDDRVTTSNLLPRGAMKYRRAASSSSSRTCEMSVCTGACRHTTEASKISFEQVLLCACLERR